MFRGIRRGVCTGRMVRAVSGGFGRVFVFLMLNVTLLLLPLCVVRTVDIVFLITMLFSALSHCGGAGEDAGSPFDAVLSSFSSWHPVLLKEQIDSIEITHIQQKRKAETIVHFQNDKIL